MMYIKIKLECNVLIMIIKIVYSRLHTPLPPGHYYDISQCRLHKPKTITATTPVKNTFPQWIKLFQKQIPRSSRERTPGNIQTFKARLKHLYHIRPDFCKFRTKIPLWLEQSFSYIKQAHATSLQFLWGAQRTL